VTVLWTEWQKYVCHNKFTGSSNMAFLLKSLPTPAL
jgi:hypothetical protein